MLRGFTIFIHKTHLARLLQGTAMHDLLQTSSRIGVSTPQMWHAGCNSLRISIEWALIEPTRGSYDHWAIQRYHDIFKEIIA